MKKFTFTVDVVTDSQVSVDAVRKALLESVHGIGTYSAAKAHDAETLTDQGLKVWAKRCAGISLATPKAKKVKAETPAVVEG